MVTDEELSAIDEIVQQRPELTIHSGLCLQFPAAAESPLADFGDTKDDLAHSGVHAVSALARLEIAAMLAGHLPRRASIPRPLLPRPDERADYVEFLRDAVLFHAYAIGTTAGQAASRPFTKADTFTYERRVKQAERLTRLLYQLEQTNLTSKERSELRMIQRRLVQISETVRNSLAIGAR